MLCGMIMGYACDETNVIQSSKSKTKPSFVLPIMDEVDGCLVDDDWN